MKQKLKRRAIKESLLVAEGGTTEWETTEGKDELMTEKQILWYAKTSFAQWKRNPEQYPELSQFSLFMQLNDGDSDLMASWDEVQPLLNFVKEVKDEEGKVVHDKLARMKKAFDDNQALNFLNFRQFQSFMKDLELDEEAEKIDKFFYRMYFRSNCCLLCLGKCCAGRLRRTRMKQVANRLKKMIEIEHMRTPSKPVDAFMLIISALQVLGGFAQLFDFYSDIVVLYVVYYASISKEAKEISNDYQVALTICFISLVATFMAQQSCIIGMKFAQGDFEPQNFTKFAFLNKIINILLLTFTGAFFLVPVELLDNLSKVFALPGLLFGGSKGVRKVTDCFTFVKQKITGLNAYQLNSLEKQRRVTALLFENLPFTLLVLAIKTKFLKCPQLDKGGSSTTINISLASTMLQVMGTVIGTKMESSWLKESTLSYLMTKMTANNNWIPFIHLIAKRQCDININYGDLSIKMPFISHALGHYALTHFEFSDSTLNYLLNELKLWSSEVNGQPLKQKYKLTFTKDCLNEVSLNAFIHFVQNFPEDVFQLEIQLDWKQFYDKKEQEQKIQFIIENGLKRTYSPTGVPLLQLCIQNETSSKNWPLRSMLSIILDSGHYSIQPTNHESPLTVALQDSCFESLLQINNGDYNFDYQTQDARGLSFIGQLIYKMQNLSEERGVEFDKLSNFSQTIFENINLDMHKNQFINTGTIQKQISAWQLIFKNLRHHRKIKFATQQLIDIAERQGDFDINDAERQTLFKNTVKLLMAHGSDAARAWKQLGVYCMKCKVDVFTTKDKNGKGLVHKLVKSWPLQIEKARQFEAILENIVTDEMKEKNVNSQSLIYQQIIDENLLLGIFKGSIHMSETILTIDSQNKEGMVIKNLNTPELRKAVINHVAYSMLTLQRNYDKLMPQVKQRFNEDNFEYTIKEAAIQMSDGFRSRGKKDEGDEEVNEFEGGKLTRRKQGGGNLKRKVGSELQEDPPLQNLDQYQIENLGLVIETAAQIRRKKLGGALRNLLETILEWIAAADLYTDIFVFLQLLKTDHHAWTTITIFSMLAPFFACQTPFLMFLKEKVYRDVHDRLKLRFMGSVMVSPLMLIYMFILDIIFVINQALLFPIICVIKFLTFGLLDLTCLNRGLEMSYEFLFEMQKLEVAGFRRMRTISQLTFESLIQFLLQVRMLQFFNNLKDKKAIEEFGVSYDAIVISVTLALSHALLECIFLYMEAQASKTSFLNYCIVCFNGRFGWVPYNDYLIITSQKLQDDNQLKSQKSIKKIEIQKLELDYQNIQSNICCFQMEVEFMFSDSTIMALSKTLATFPKVQNEKDMPVIKFGPTINQVSLENLVNLLKVCQGRVYIDLQGADLMKIFKNSKHRNIIENQNVETLSEEDKKYVFFLQESDLFQLLGFVLKNNEQILKAQKQSNDEDEQHEESNLIWIAYQKKDAKLLELLLSLDSDVLKAQMAEIKDRHSLTLRLINTMDFDIWQCLAINSTVFDPHQESFFFQAFMDHQTQDPAFFNRSLKWWHSRFGPAFPQEIVSDVKRWSSAYDFMMDSRKLYPEKIYFSSGTQFVEVECKTAFCFAGIRKKLVKAWDITSTGPSIDQDASKGTINLPMDLTDLRVSLSDFKLLNMLLSDEEHNNVKNLTDKKVQELDEMARKLKLDIGRWLYVGRSRLGDETGNQIEVIFYGKDTYCTYYGSRSDKPLNRLANGANSKINKLPYDQMTFYDSVEVQMPENMNWITLHETTIALPPDNTVMSTFIFQKDNSFLGYLFSYGSQKKVTYTSDAVAMAQLDEIQRTSKMNSSKGFYMLGSITPGSKVQYCPHPLHHRDTTSEKLRITMHIDFPPDADIQKEQAQLESQAQRLRNEYKESIPKYQEAYNNRRD